MDCVVTKMTITKEWKMVMFYRGMNDYFNSDKSYFLDSLDNVESI